jgi:hypothetical protein
MLFTWATAIFIAWRKPRHHIGIQLILDIIVLMLSLALMVWAASVGYYWIMAIYGVIVATSLWVTYWEAGRFLALMRVKSRIQQHSQTPVDGDGVMS